MQPLFIEPSLRFEKVAAETVLSEDPNNWPQEILQELYRQIPYIADFDPQVVMDRVDSERGYALGQVVVTSKSEAQAGVDPGQAQAAGLRTVRLPILIKERKLSPFDLLVSDKSKTLPLTEGRFRQVMFRPQAFDVTSQLPGDQSLIGQLYPPYRTNSGFAGAGLSMGGTVGKIASVNPLEAAILGETKVAADQTEELIKDLEARDAGFRKIEFKKTASLLNATFSTYHQTDINNFLAKVAGDENLQEAYRANSRALSGPLYTLTHFEPMSVEKRASALFSSFKPSVVQVQKLGLDRYSLKTASVHYWSPVEAELTRGEVVRQFGPKVALAADESGQVTMTDAPEPEDGSLLDTPSPETVTQPGTYQVVDESTGTELVGMVIPNLLDLDGTPLPLSLFTNGTQTALQPSVLGTLVGGASSLPTAPPKGQGVFFHTTKQGQIQATIPLELQAGSTVVDGQPSVRYFQSFDGRSGELSQQPGIQTMLTTPEGRVLVPEDWLWSPMSSAQVSLTSGETGYAPDGWHDSTEREDPTDLEGLSGPGEEKPAKEAGYLVARGGPDVFDLEGPAVAKLAAADTRGISLDQAMFLLGGLGIPLGDGVTKLANAHREPQVLQATRRIKTAAEQDSWALSKVANYSPLARNLKRDLSKEAAAIPDPTTADTVLSLGFINPENIMMFVSFLPTIEEAQAKLCELLLAARVGLSQVPSSALERAIRSTEEVIEGLKILAFQGSN